MEVLRCTDSQGFNVRLSGRTNLDQEVIGSTLNEEVDLTGVVHEGCSFTVREVSCESFGTSGLASLANVLEKVTTPLVPERPLLPSKVAIVAPGS